MNISQMMRSFLGEASSADSRAIELKVGQIVRGVILQVMENNEALVQINGVQVRAKLEIPLQVGQSAMLQVQPQSGGALVMLKQVEPGAVGLPEDTFKEWAKQLALPEQKWAALLVKDLRKEGVILNCEVAQVFQQTASAMPEGGDAKQWMQAAAATFKRGLPMTGATVGAMQQVMFGRSAHELLETLQQQLSSIAADTDGVTAAKPLPHAAARVLALLTEGMELLRGATSSSASEALRASGAGSKEAAAAKPQNAQLTRTDLPQGSAAVLAAGEEGSGQQAMPQAARAAASPPNWLGQMMKWMGVDHELQLAKAVTMDTQSSQQAPALQSQTASAVAAVKPSAASPNHPSPQIVPAVEVSSKEAAQTVITAQGSTGDAEDQQSMKIQELKHSAERAAAAVISAVAEGMPAAGSSSPAQQESLKSALISLVSAENTPPAIKETAQQLVQQITGQQLLLTPERNSSVLTHVTMFIPLNNTEGKQTASVHIQTRRGRKGELDSSNCRLLFNLSMNTLGDTMVDVNVMDKIVSLNLWNDHPAISMLAESSRSEIAGSLQQAGYQLLSLRTKPLPKAGEQRLEETGAAAKNQQLPEMSAFSSNRYKGVDYRI
ncbi:hypothetical protein [Paenibacillus sp. Soil522]|uniref:hypothetical protein n=1 Tax=Paenibacillus sp. Soil522 TaxID=1736388 RepID=UPI0006F62B50|nr:hypothetical protein [Paenibacillus sp. Soil522]KRE39825.1 hypothetical protein ASG81_18035 [Paenibacillus sp. Soil522]